MLQKIYAEGHTNGHYQLIMHAALHYRTWNTHGISETRITIYKVVQIWPRLFVCKQVTVCPGHIWTTLYYRQLRQAIALWRAPGKTAIRHQVLLKNRRLSQQLLSSYEHCSEKLENVIQNTDTILQSEKNHVDSSLPWTVTIKKIKILRRWQGGLT